MQLKYNNIFKRNTFSVIFTELRRRIYIYIYSETHTYVRIGETQLFAILSTTPKTNQILPNENAWNI